MSLFVPCYVDQFAPEVAEASRRVLERAGCTVEIPPGQTCCGQPAFNAGYSEEARTVARTFLDAFEASDAVVMPSGSCAAMARVFYGPLFAGTEDEERAVSIGTRTFELSEYLVDHLGVTDLGAAWHGSVVWHDGCHGLRELGAGEAPRRLLRNVRGLELVEAAEARCCGFGGTFSVKHPEISVAMADARLEDLGILKIGAGPADPGMHKTGAGPVEGAARSAAVVSGDVSCLLHLRGRARRLGFGLPFLHIAQILASD